MYPRDRFAPPRQVGYPTTPTAYVYPDERPPTPILYGPKGEPLYKAKSKFGYRKL